MTIIISELHWRDQVSDFGCVLSEIGMLSIAYFAR
jgi:hypothetical protein